MKKSRKLLTVLLAVALCLFACFAAASCGGGGDSEKTETTEEMIQRVSCGVVEIKAAQTGGGGEMGSGFIVSDGDGGCVIITNHHVVEGSDALWVRFFGEDDFVAATLKGYNEDFDIAVLATSSLPLKYHVFQFGGAPVLGQQIVSLGYAGGRLSAYCGSVSAKDRWINLKDNLRDGWYYVFETGVAAPQGTSGGPCLGYDGKVVGLNCFNYTYDGLLAGVSFKTPAPIVAAMYSRIISSEQHTAAPVTGMEIRENEMLVLYENGSFLSENRFFSVELSPSGALRIKDSGNPDFPDGAIVATVNGKKADFCTLAAEFCLTGPDTRLVIKGF